MESYDRVAKIVAPKREALKVRGAPPWCPPWCLP